jgi:hypothetical protein
MSMGKLSLLERVLKGSFEFGKYMSVAGIMASLGCFEGYNPTTVSQEGRYIAMGVSESGAFLLPDNDSKIVPVIVDTSTNKVKKFDIVRGQFIPFSNSSDRIAAMTNDEKTGLTNVVILSDMGNIKIEGASFPKLYLGGSHLSFIKIKDKNKDGTYNTDLMFRSLHTNTDQLLGRNVSYAELSPNMRHILYVDSNLNQNRMGNKRITRTLLVSDINGDNKNLVSELDLGFNLINCFPHWIDNDKYMFRTRGKKTGLDPEIYLGDRRGNIEQVTNNDFVESSPHVNPGERINGMPVVYSVVRSKEGNILLKSVKGDNGWESKRIFEGDYCVGRVVGNKFVYYIDKGNYKIADLEDIGGKLPINLTERFRASK